tara:strand:+ start:707 stop:859 length:153 start_codon:yes stop_codon:yes gene_type:complete
VPVIIVAAFKEGSRADHHEAAGAALESVVAAGKVLPRVPRVLAAAGYFWA